MKSKFILWGSLLLALLSACRLSEEATPMPPTVSPTPTPTALEATPTSPPVVPTATGEATSTPPPATSTATEEPTPTLPPATPTATEEPTPTPQPTPTPKGMWPEVVTKLELGVPTGNGYLPRAIAVNSATGYVYVRNDRSDSEERDNVSVIDGATNEIIATIPIGQGGWDYSEVAVDETTREVLLHRVYVVNREDETLTVIGGDTHQVLATIEGVEAVAVDEARNRLYVANGETVRLLDAVDYSELRSNDLALRPSASINALAFNPSANRLYLARSSPDALDILTASTLNRVDVVPLKGPVQDLAVNTVTNRLYAALGSLSSEEAASLTNEILTLDGTSGKSIASLVVGDQYQESVLAVDEMTDRLYVGRATSREPSVAVVNGATGQIVDQIGPVNSVRGIAFDPSSGRLYLSLTYDNQVAVIDTEQKGTVALVPTAIEVTDAAVDPSGQRVYVTDSINQLHVFESTDYEELAVVPGCAPLAVDDVRHRVYVSDPDGEGIQIIDGQTNQTMGLIPQTGRPVVNPKTNELYIVESGIYIADPETQSVVGKIDSTFPKPHGLPPNPSAVGLAIDPQLNLLYGVISNGVPGSNSGTYLQVYDGLSHTSVFTDTELSVVSIDVDPTVGRAYVIRSHHSYSSLKVLAEGERWVARVEGIVGNLRVDPNQGLVYMTSGWDKGPRLLIVDGQTADLLADFPLDGEYTLRALDPLAERLYLIGEGGSVLVMAESGGEPPSPIEPKPTKLPASPIQRIVVSPNYTRDQTLLVLAENRLYKSEDAGESWMLIDGRLPPYRDMVSVAFSPNYASDQTLLAGLSTWGLGSGVYQSTDGGRSWRSSSRGLSDLQVQGVAFAADGTTFARTMRHGLFESTDGEKHWVALEEPQVDGSTNRRATALAISPSYAADSTLFWSMDGDPYLILKSTDGGQSWQKVLNRTAQTLAISPDYRHDRTVYAVLSGAGLMRSTDGGETWQAANSGLIYENAVLSDLALSPSFAEDRTLYALFTAFHSEGVPRLYRSTDRGDNWEVLEEDVPISALALAPDGDLLLGTVYGRIRSLRADGQSWGDLMARLDDAGSPPADVYDLAISPGYAQDQTIYASTATAGVFVSRDGGRNWTETGFPGRAGGSTDYPRLAISPDYTEDQTLFAASGAGVYRSRGGSWEELQEGLGNLFPASALAISPNFPTDVHQLADGYLFVGGDYRRPQVFTSTDGGENWTPASHGFPKAEVVSLVVSPNFSEDRTAYAWLQYQGLYRTTDGGRSWEQIKEEEEWYVQSMALSPDFAADVHRLADGSLFIGAMYGNLHRSDDGGFTWQSLGGGLQPGTIWVKALAVSPEFAKDGTLFAGLSQGIHKSTDGGYSWQAINTGLPHRADGELAGVLALAISPDYAADVHRPADGCLFAALFEHGVYKSIDGGANWYPPTWGTPPPTPPPSPTPAAPTITLTPLPSPTPLRLRSTPTPEATPTPCSVAPVRFAATWADRRDRLGCPTEAEREIPLAEEAFKRGRMFWRGDSGEIYVLHDDRTWRAFADTWREGQPPDDPNLVPPPGLFQPKRGFGKVWREELGGPASQIGWATEEERGGTGVVQAFDGGAILWSNVGTTYILYADGSWEQYAQR